MLDGLLGLIILVLDIYAVIQVWKHGKDSTEKILWTAVIVLLPFIGLVFWWFKGPK